MLQRTRAESKREFTEFLDLWPRGSGSFPVLYTGEQMRQLEGSPVVEMIYQIKDAAKEAYKRICKAVP